MTGSPSGSVTEFHVNVGVVSLVAAPSIGPESVGTGGGLFGRMVSTCVPLVRPVAATVTVGDPATESRYLKTAVLEPPLIATDVMTVVGVVASRNSPVTADDERLTVVEPVVTGLSNWSRRWTVRFAELVLILTEIGALVITSLLADVAA